MKYEIKKVYFVNLENYFLIAKSFQEEKSMFSEFINLLNLKLILKKKKVNPALKINFSNNITIYEKQKHIKIIKNLTKENPRI